MARLSEQSDEALMELLDGGEDEALAMLVERYQNDVFRFCLHYVKNVDTAREMSQETYLRVYAARSRFDASRKFKPWMLCIARNLCLNELKRKKAVQMEMLEDYANIADEQPGQTLQHPEPNAVETMMAAERRQAVMQILDELPADAREMVVLRYFELLSAREIAEIVGSKEGAVRTRLHRILRQLRDRCVELKQDLL